MAFNGGGTNVGGVQGIEQGELKIGKNTISTPTVSDNNSLFTVPTGKIWILKAINHTSYSLVSTVSEVRTKLVHSGDTMILNLTSGNSKVEFMTTTNIQLSEGDSVSLDTKLTAYTSGTITHLILYQEVDA